MKRALMLALLAISVACKENPKENKEEKEEVIEIVKESENEWVTLFDGSSFEGWHYYNGGPVTEPWKLEDGAMVFYPPENREEGASFNLVSDAEFTDFILTMEWKIAEGGNSGIFWGVSEDEKYAQPYLTGPEIQVLDNERHPDAQNGENRMAGALYDMVSPTQHVTKPAGEWNTFELMVNHKTNKGHVVLNGTKIVEFPVHGPDWDKMVTSSKFADWEGFGAYRTGKIGLQDHGDRVSYKNIKIKAL
ncbi:DUF1080 domain-containing protein [Allomuricauda sp. XS_ASV26]|uniref:3-keto-disaccharide hydrolase n=1 Tax=Allomuricauda sp. XS_ASV26 TaxID=3241292 RepID=UPI00351891F9